MYFVVDDVDDYFGVGDFAVVTKSTTMTTRATMSCDDNDDGDDGGGGGGDSNDYGNGDGLEDEDDMQLIVSI